MRKDNFEAAAQHTADGNIEDIVKMTSSKCIGLPSPSSYFNCKLTQRGISNNVLRNQE